jgi:hypothetical protein
MVTSLAPAPNDNALRQRKWRARQKDPIQAVYLVTVPPDTVRKALLSTCRFPANEISHRDWIARALGGVIA